MIVDLIQAHPRISIILISLIFSFFITLVNYFVLDREKLRTSRQRQKELQAESKKHKGNPTKQMEISREMASHSLEQMKHSLKPAFITMIPGLVVFWWIRGVFAETTIAGTWFWWYFISAIVSSIIFRKIFKLA